MANRVVYVVGTNLVYARIQELGGTITPKNAPYLTFYIDGQFIRTKSVTIPARPYLRPAYDERKDEAVAVIGKAFEAGVITRHVL